MALLKLQRGLTNDENVHSERDEDDHRVELHERLVLFQSRLDQRPMNGLDEVEVQPSIHTEVNSLFTSIPNVVGPNITFRYLKSRWNPYTVDGHVDGCDESSDCPLQTSGLFFIDHQDPHSVDDDLKKELDLKRPHCDFHRGQSLGKHRMTGQ